MVIMESKSADFCCENLFYQMRRMFFYGSGCMLNIIVRCFYGLMMNYFCTIQEMNENEQNKNFSKRKYQVNFLRKETGIQTSRRENY